MKCILWTKVNTTLYLATNKTKKAYQTGQHYILVTIDHYAGLELSIGNR